MGISFEEFIDRLQTVQKDFSDDVEIVLNRGANRMVRALKQIVQIVERIIKEN